MSSRQTEEGASSPDMQQEVEEDEEEEIEDGEVTLLSAVEGGDTVSGRNNRHKRAICLHELSDGQDEGSNSGYNDNLMRVLVQSSNRVGLGDYVKLPANARQILGAVLRLGEQSVSCTSSMEDYPFTNTLKSALKYGIVGLSTLGSVPMSWLTATEEQEEEAYQHATDFNTSEPTATATDEGFSVADSFLETAREKNSSFCGNTQRSLYRLRHAGGCSGRGCDGVSPCKFDRCGMTRALWEHLQTCSDENCNFGRCFIASWEVCTIVYVE